jgi:hypothetical protein
VGGPGIGRLDRSRCAQLRDQCPITRFAVMRGPKTGPRIARSEWSVQILARLLFTRRTRKMPAGGRIEFEIHSVDVRPLTTRPLGTTQARGYAPLAFVESSSACGLTSGRRPIAPTEKGPSVVHSQLLRPAYKRTARTGLLGATYSDPVPCIMLATCENAQQPHRRGAQLDARAISVRQCPLSTPR